MNLNDNWNQIIQTLPGIFLKDQHPQGTGIAVSIEYLNQGKWYLNYVKESQNMTVVREGPFAALSLYERLQELFDDVGFTPQLNDQEREILNLPSYEQIYSERVLKSLPGRYIGSQEIAGKGLNWNSDYSVQNNSDGTYTLFSCNQRSEDDCFTDLEVEEIGTYTLHEVIEELQIIGFHPEDYSFLLELTAASWDELLQYMPGLTLLNQNPAENGCLLSIKYQDPENWTLYYAINIVTNKYKLNNIPELTAKEVYKKTYDLIGRLLTPKEVNKLKLPELDEIYKDTLMKRMKGFYIGAVADTRKPNRYTESYFSVDKSKDGTWLLHVVFAEDLINLGKTGRKIPIHKIGPYRNEEIHKIIAEIEKGVDLLEFVLKLKEIKKEETSELLQLIMKEAGLD